MSCHQQQKQSFLFSNFLRAFTVSPFHTFLSSLSEKLNYARHTNILSSPPHDGKSLEFPLKKEQEGVGEKWNQEAGNSHSKHIRLVKAIFFMSCRWTVMSGKWRKTERRRKDICLRGAWLSLSLSTSRYEKWVNILLTWGEINIDIRSFLWSH